MKDPSEKNAKEADVDGTELENWVCVFFFATEKLRHYGLSSSQGDGALAFKRCAQDNNCNERLLSSCSSTQYFPDSH